MKQPKVLFLARYGHPLDTGGVANAIKNIVKYTSEKGVEYRIFSIRSKTSITPELRKTGYDNKKVKLDMLSPAKGFGTKNNPLFSSAIDDLVSKILDKTKDERIDLIQSFTVYPNYVAIASKLSKELRIPYMISARGTDVYEHNQEYNYDKDKEWYHSPIRDTSVITTLSDYLRDEVINNLSSVGIHDKNVVVVHNGVDTDLFKPHAKNISDGKIRAVYTGRIRGFKGIMDIVNAIGQSIKDGIDAEFDVYGSSEKGLGDKVIEDLNNYIKENGLSEKIRCTGKYIPNSKLPELYSKHNLFLTASRGEGLPNAIMEAMSCGLAVCLNNSSGAKDFGLSKEMIFETGNISQMSQIIKMLAENPEMIRINGERNRDFALRHHWKDIANQYYNIYLQIIRS
jgi:glycosyltransferase involved in cell wall biosynthesis